MKTKNRFKRFMRHLFTTPWLVRRYFPAAAMRNIQAEIRQSESLHSGEIRFVVEAALHPFEILRGETPRQRALEWFARLGVWDTAENNGILLYLLLADHDVEIVADRGIHARVGTEGWEAICHEMEAAFRRGEFESGVILGIKQIGAVLHKHFPAEAANNKNELPDAPLVL
ncbi:MAG TPA: TPM domain-containing protein [Methylophilaceae bacterium]|nr:TPM domain-containing protein [Methylophilaceae bacterium]